MSNPNYPGACLRYPDTLPPHKEMPVEMAVQWLLKAAHIATQTPFSWSYIDKPQDGTLVLLYLPHPQPFVVDGIRWQDQETRWNLPIPVGTTQTEVEVHEVKYGFIPGAGEPVASRVRRRYRLTRAGNPSLIVVHYSRGPASAVPPAIMNEPIRRYPLQPINQPSVYVAGERQGQKVFPSGPQGHPPPGGSMLGGPASRPPLMGAGGPGAMNMLAAQNANMAEMQRRSEQSRMREAAVARERAAIAAANRTGRPEEHAGGEFDDENDLISAKGLAMARYRRNHDWMNEVFSRAAYGDIVASSTVPEGFGVFDLKELEEKATALTQEVEELKTKSSTRKSSAQDGQDAVMQDVSA